jgi:hypothetical protein
MLKIFAYIVGLLMFTSASILAAPMESENFRLEKTVVSSGGGFGISGNFKMNGTVGQSTPIGLLSSASYRLMPGFWHQILLMIAEGDVNGDGIINLQDAILALRILSNFQSIDVQRDADVNGDGSVGIAEVLFILQKVGSQR